MKKMNLFLCLISCVSFLHAASAFRLVESQKDSPRYVRLQESVLALQRSAQEYKQSMRDFAKERSELERLGISITAGSHPDSNQSKVKKQREDYAAKKTLVLLEVLKNSDTHSLKLYSQNEADLIRQVIKKSDTPESEPFVDQFWKIDEAVKLEENVYKIPTVFPDTSSSDCSLQ